VLAHYAWQLGELMPRSPRFPALRAAYLEAATAVACGPRLVEPDRSAVLGLVALERGDTARALAHLGWAAEHGGRLEDHVAHIEALVRAGELTRARDAAGALTAAHPTYDLGEQWQAALGGLGETEACA
jgi:hypothetical protein